MIGFDLSSPAFTNKEGFNWHIDKSVTEWCSTEKMTGEPALPAICFLVEKDGKVFSRVLIDKNTNEVLADETSLDAMGSKIDFLRIALRDNGEI